MLIQPAATTKQQKGKEKETKPNNVDKKQQNEKENVQPLIVEKQAEVESNHVEKQPETDETMKKREEFFKKMNKPTAKPTTT